MHEIEKYRNRNIEVLWDKIKDIYYTYDLSTLTGLWELKSAVMQETIKVKGESGNISLSGLRKFVLQ